MSKTTNKFSPEVRERAIRMVQDHQVDYPSRWAAVVSIAEKIGCVPQTLHEWVKKSEIDSGKRTGVLADMGLTVSDAVRILLTKVAKEKALPFDLNPNALTADTLRKSERGEDVHYAKDADELFDDLGI